MKKIIFNCQANESETVDMLPEEIEEWERRQQEMLPQPQPSETDILGQRVVEQELQVMQLQTDNQVLGMQMAQKDLEIMRLQSDNQMLGQTVVDLELRLTQGGL